MSLFAKVYDYNISRSFDLARESFCSRKFLLAKVVILLVRHQQESDKIHLNVLFMKYRDLHEPCTWSDYHCTFSIGHCRCWEHAYFRHCFTVNNRLYHIRNEACNQQPCYWHLHRIQTSSVLYQHGLREMNSPYNRFCTSVN